jgi:NAD(P)-dependent dehydrogenase (short-subunit alcohol dehydrogenase family)
MSGRLQSKIAVVTAGTSGIGLATARLFSEDGAYVFIMGRRQGKLDQADATMGSHVVGVRGDVTNLDDLDRLYDTVRTNKGPWTSCSRTRAGRGRSVGRGHGIPFRQAARHQREGSPLHGAEGPAVAYEEYEPS